MNKDSKKDLILVQSQVEELLVKLEKNCHREQPHIGPGQ